MVETAYICLMHKHIYICDKKRIESEMRVARTHTVSIVGCFGLFSMRLSICSVQVAYKRLWTSVPHQIWINVLEEGGFCFPSARHNGEYAYNDALSQCLEGTYTALFIVL